MNRTLATAPHDHAACVAKSLAWAETLCARRGLRLTELRRQVLELVWRSHRPQGAYDILEALQARGRRAAPPTVYRALDFLLDQGLIHRLQSMNAFVGCTMPGRPHRGQYLICRACGLVEEIDDSAIDGAIEAGAAAQGFALERQTVELTGLCGPCRDGDHG